jgi:hypothetical protein
LERVRLLRGKTEVEVVYGRTSLGRDRSDASELLGRTRQHWGIENRLHYVRDETLGEDRCRVRKGHGAQVLAALRNACVHLLECQGHKQSRRHAPLGRSSRGSPLSPLWLTSKGLQP